MNELRGLKLLGLPIRYKIVSALCNNKMTHAEIAQAVEKPLGVYSHLREMIEEGIVIKDESDPKDILYWTNPEAIQQIQEFLGRLVHACYNESE